MCCSRQSGKSTVVSKIAALKAGFKKDSLTLLLSPALRQSGELFIKVCKTFEENPWLPEITKLSALQMTLENGSRIISLPGKPDTILGFSGVDLIIIDEAARVPDTLYYAVRPMLAVSGGDLIVLSTPFGKQGWFYEAWHSNQDWQRYRITADMCPRISREFLEEEKVALGDWWYSQEYMCEFRDTMDQFFDSRSIEMVFTDQVSPLFTAKQPAQPIGGMLSDEVKTLSL
jgi:hypothetical protein